MISCFMLEAEFFKEPKKFKNMDFIIDKIDKHREIIFSYPTEVIVKIIGEYSSILRKKRELLGYEGVPFLSLWLKEDNIRKCLKNNFHNVSFLDEFIEVEDKKYMKAQPRGIVCHFMSGNVPTLPIYSLVQALLCKNINLIRIPLESIKIVIELLKPLLNIEIDFHGKRYSGKELLSCVSVIYFSSDDRKLNEEMSSIADVRIIYGGEIAVNSISSLPKKTSCKDIVFGPKYSFAVFDKSALESPKLLQNIKALAQDIISFNQNACTSPQVLFVEKSRLNLKEVGCFLAEALEELSKKYPNDAISEKTAAEVLNKRGEYLLSLDKDVIFSKEGIDYTILIDKNINLEEPVNGRTIFLKEVYDIFDICKLITPRVQTIGIASYDEERTKKFASKVSLRGTFRIVRVGGMNFYASPWDGILLMSELVKWVSLNLK